MAERWGLDRTATRLLVLLVLTDLVYFGLHGVYLTGKWDGVLEDHANPYSIEVDRGYGEFFQYAKWMWCVLLLGHVALWRRWTPFVSWLLLFTYLAVDDSVSFHERAGFFLADRLGLGSVLGLPASDVAELGVAATVGAVLLGGVAWAYVRGDASFRRGSRTLFSLVLLMVLFGVVVDALHQVVGEGAAMQLFGFIEDGGEMLVLSAIVAFLFALAARSDQHADAQAAAQDVSEEERTRLSATRVQS